MNMLRSIVGSGTNLASYSWMREFVVFLVLVWLLSLIVIGSILSVQKDIGKTVDEKQFLHRRRLLARVVAGDRLRDESS